MWIRRAVKVNNDLMKIIREELVTEKPLNRQFTPYELVKYPLPSDMSQIKLANPFFMVCYLISRWVGVATKEND